MDLQDRVDELQSEVEALDSQLKRYDKRTLFLFLGAIAVPFVAYGLVYATGFSWIITDGERDRKKAIRWSALIAVIVWISMYAYYRFFMKIKT